MNWHSKKADEAAKELGSDLILGLSDHEVQQKAEKYGKNKLSSKPPKTMIQRFADQLKDVMVIILIIAAAISFVVALTDSENPDFLEPVIILAIVVLNAVLGVVQESKAENALEALKNMTSPSTKVLRNGKMDIIPSSDIVPGDIVKLEAGDFIPADCRIIECASLKVDESPLTGESLPVEKISNNVLAEETPLSERFNMLYSGCSISNGRCTAIVTSTGMNTEIGRIAKLLDNEENVQTPLQQKLAKLGKQLGILAFIICAIIFIIGIVEKMNVMDIFITSVSLAVAAIPEGLPAIVTIVLAIGVQRMVKKNAIIRKLPAVETLGSASVICSDKTGTLTQNKMTVTHIWTKDNIEDAKDNLSNESTTLLQMATLCCDGIVENSNGNYKHIGDPTETSIVYAALQHGFIKSELMKEYPRKGEIPFDSDRKLMTTIHPLGDKYIAIVKGAFDIMLPKCIHGSIDEAKEINKEMSKMALRVIAVACKMYNEVPSNISPDEIECDLSLLGLIGMIDPPREEAKEAVALCKSAGIRPVMITGDHILTASAIAEKLGILNEGQKAITGLELQKMSDDELKSKIEDYSVFARVTPEDKIRIVKAWQSKENIVAMTGDGVNDAPALKAADIGCAMGITGTDVAKGAADIILTDDNFSTIVQSVKEGRCIYDNIIKSVKFLLCCNTGEIFTILLSMLFWKETPLLAMQILWINLVTDSLPALALGMEPVENDIMERKPKDKNAGIFNTQMLFSIIIHGLFFAIITLSGYNIGKYVMNDISAGRTMTFIILAFSQLFHAFNVRSSHSLFKIGPFSNGYMNKAFLISALLIVVLIVIPPLGSIFGIVHLPVELHLAALGLSLVPIVVSEFEKLVSSIYHKNKNKKS